MNVIRKVLIMTLVVMIAITASVSVTASCIKRDTLAATLDLNVISSNEQLVYDYYNSINDGDWQAWAEYYARGIRESYENFVSDKDSQANRTGILAVDSTRVISITKVSNTYAPYYRELEQYYNSPESYECYMVGIDMTVSKETKYYYNGINYKLVIIVNDDGEWGIGATCGCPAELMLNAKGTLPVEEAIESYSERAFGSSQNFTDSNIITHHIGQGFISGDLSSPPSTINVGDGKVGSGGQPERKSDATFTPTFSDYVYNATSNEIPYTYDEEAIKACAVAVKMYAWWCSLGTYREAYGCDLLGNYDQTYDNTMTTYPSAVSTAIDDVIDYYIISGSDIGKDSGKLFSTNCNNYKSNNYAGSGRLIQSGAQSLATNSNYSWQEIVHYYFDNSTYNHDNCGVVQIGTHTGM